MGYCVDMELRNVSFEKDKTEEIKAVLLCLNEVWLRTNDWCRFNPSEDIIEILENIGFDAEESDSVININYFIAEKLGDHENMFEKMAPYMNDCQIVIYGEDGTDWRLDIEDGEMSKIYRDEL